MKYKDLKTGMDIVCKIKEEKVVGKISIDSDGDVCIYYPGHLWWWLEKGQDPCECEDVTDFHFSRTLHDLVLVEGDILVDKYGYEREVLGVCGKAIIVSEINNFLKSDSPYTAEELEERGYKLKDQPQ